MNDKKEEVSQRNQNGNTDGSGYEIPRNNTNDFEMSLTTDTAYATLQDREAKTVKQWNASVYNIQEDPYYSELKVGGDGYINMQGLGGDYYEEMNL